MPDISFAAGDVKATSRTRVPGMSASASNDMDVLDRTTFTGDLGLRSAHDNLSFAAGYSLLDTQHRTAHTVNATVRYQF